MAISVDNVSPQGTTASAGPDMRRNDRLIAASAAAVRLPIMCSHACRSSRMRASPRKSTKPKTAATSAKTKPAPTARTWDGPDGRPFGPSIGDTSSCTPPSEARTEQDAVRSQVAAPLITAIAEAWRFGRQASASGGRRKDCEERSVQRTAGSYVMLEFADDQPEMLVCPCALGDASRATQAFSNITVQPEEPLRARSRSVHRKSGLT